TCALTFLITDSSRVRLRSATQKGTNTHHGEILAEHARYEADLTPYTKMLVITIDTSYNVLVTQSFAPEFGYQYTFSLTPTPGSNIYQENMPNTIRSHLLCDEKATFVELNRKINTTHSIQILDVTEENKITKDSLPEDTTPLFVKRKHGSIEFVTQL